MSYIEKQNTGSIFRDSPLRLVFLALTFLLMMVSLYMIFLWVPTDLKLGLVQRVLYFHMPVALVGMFAFVLIFIGSVLYLWRRDQKWDALAYAAAEVGFVLTTLMLITGMIFGRPSWGVWWQWDARLTTSLILWFLYVAYFMVRGYATTSDQGARYAAALGIIGFIDVPIVYFSVHWWRTVHPPTVVGPLSESASIAPSMALTLLVSLVAISVLSAYLILERYSLRQVEFKLEEVRRNYGES